MEENDPTVVFFGGLAYVVLNRAHAERLVAFLEHDVPMQNVRILQTASAER
jgi:hypothetical protein